VLAQKGSRVLLIDADLRRPNIGKLLHLDQSSSGLSTVLTGGDKLESVVRQVSFVPNLFVLPAGPVPPQPAELLGSDQMRELIAQLREQYDHIIIDTSPMLTVTDPVLLSVDIDAVALVIRAAQTTKHALRRSRDLLARVNASVLGVVVNAVDIRSVDSHYYYYYHYESGEGYYDMNTVGAEASRKNS
jgi:capsular exopolysaccharide synthesis family protein